MRPPSPESLVLAVLLLAPSCGAPAAVEDDGAGQTSASGDGDGVGETGVGETGDGETGTGDEPCDMLEQDCGPGQKCVAYTLELGGDWVSTACVEASPEGAPVGGICFSGEGGLDTCGPGSMCLQLGTGEGVCFSLCDAPATPGGQPECGEVDGQAFNCERLDAGQERPLAQGVYLCQLDCDPLVEQACPAQLLGCYPGASRFSCRIRDPAAKPEGWACDGHLGCAGGTLCSEPRAASGCGPGSCCVGYCELGAAGACEDSVAGPDCVALFEPGAAPAGHELVGVCL